MADVLHVDVGAFAVGLSGPESGTCAATHLRRVDDRAREAAAAAGGVGRATGAVSGGGVLRVAAARRKRGEAGPGAVSEKWRQRRLHVENRLAELDAKYGRVEDLGPWDETYPWRHWLIVPPEGAAKRGKVRQSVGKLSRAEAGPLWEREAW